MSRLINIPQEWTSLDILCKASKEIIHFYLQLPKILKDGIVTISFLP